MQGKSPALVDIAGITLFCAMAKDTPKQNPEPISGLFRLLDGLASLVEKLYAESQAARWGLTVVRRGLAGKRTATKRSGDAAPPRQKLEDYLAGLHLEDLALATACAAGCESAWEHFFATYRQYLYSAAAAITRRPLGDAYACEFADSLYATLYGRETALGRVSLFRSEEHTSELQSRLHLVCRLLLEKKN